MKGRKHSTATRRRMSSTQSSRQTTPAVERDYELLKRMGSATSWEFAAALGTGNQPGKNRLRRLYEHGLADRERIKTGTTGRPLWTYTAK
jgi:predicted ArsR family transcriptional regulator